MFHRLILLVGAPGTGKTNLLSDLARERGLEVINVNLELSQVLLELTPRQRQLKLRSSIESLFSSAASLAILDNTELLFDHGLAQDPLRLLEGISRNRTVVAAWSGFLSGASLRYAVPGHSEHRVYENVDAQVLDLNVVSDSELGNSN